MFPLGCMHSMLGLQTTARFACYVCSIVETVKRNEEKAKLEEAQAKLLAVEHTCQEHHVQTAVLEAKLVAGEQAYREDHEKHSLQIHEQQRENALMQDEKRKLEKKLDDLQSELQQHTTHLHSMVPAQG